MYNESKRKKEGGIKGIININLAVMEKMVRCLEGKEEINKKRKECYSVFNYGECIWDLWGI